MTNTLTPSSKTNLQSNHKMIKLWLSILLLSPMAMAQSSASSEESISTNSGEESTEFMAPRRAPQTQEWRTISTNEILPLQLATFAARQMSTKDSKLKLVSLDSGTAKVDQDGSKLFKLRITLQRSKLDVPSDAKDVLYCTVSMQTDESEKQWSLANFGCTLPALVRRRRPKVVASSTTPRPVVEEEQDEESKMINNKSIEQNIGNDLETSPLKPRPAARLYTPSFYQRMALGRAPDNSIEGSSDEPSPLYEIRYPMKRQIKSPIPPPLPMYKSIWMHQQQVPIPIYQQRYTRSYLRPMMLHPHPLYYSP